MTNTSSPWRRSVERACFTQVIRCFMSISGMPVYLTTHAAASTRELEAAVDRSGCWVATIYVLREGVERSTDNLPRLP